MLRKQTWLFFYSALTAAATLILLGIGGLVTSHGAGMAVPDWPTSYGYNMFFFPFSYWVGGVLYEHSHRLIASLVGLLTVLLTRWLCGNRSRRSFVIIGATELAVGIVLGFLVPNLKGTGHFLSGIGGVVLFSAAIPFRNAPSAHPLPLLGWTAFWLVQFQGLLGGLRVVLLQDEIGIFHAMLAQIFFTLICVICLLTYRGLNFQHSPLPTARLVFAGTALIFLQLVIGATMRHQHAGLAIPDFPLAYNQVWPDTSPAALDSYNSKRIEITAAKPITASHIHLQMIHRLLAGGILVVIAAAAISAIRRAGLRSPASGFCLIWLGLILIQAGLGAFTIWSNKAADVATAHLLGGALSLAFGAIVCIILYRSLVMVDLTHQAPSHGTLGNTSMAGGTT